MSVSIKSYCMIFFCSCFKNLKIWLFQNRKKHLEKVKYFDLFYSEKKNNNKSQKKNTSRLKFENKLLRSKSQKNKHPIPCICPYMLLCLGNFFSEYL